MSAKLVYILVALLLYKFYTDATKMNFRTGDCKVSHVHFSNFSLKIINQTVHVDIDLIKPIINGFKMHMEFGIRKSKTKTYQILFQYHFDYCNMMKTATQSFYKRWFVNIFSYGNIPKTCPVAVGSYYIHGWTFSGDMVPSFFYLGDYRIKGHLYYGKYKTKSEVFVADCSVLGLLE